MLGKSTVLTLALAACLAAPVQSLAQDAGVSGIPRGPGSAGGLNNSVNDPSGIGNAGRIQSPPPPSMAVPSVPTMAPAVSNRLSPRSTPRVTRVDRPTTTESRSKARRSSTRASTRSRDRQIDSTLSICRGC